MNKRTIVFLFVAAAAVFVVGTGVRAAASMPSINDSGVSYPIAELGACKDKADCANFCAQPAHMVACVAYGEKQGLLKGEDLRVSKIVAEKIAKKETPGGCTDQQSCESFCKGNVKSMNQCIAFAEELNILPSDELAQAKKVAQALEGGAQLPGQCATKGECENYCSVGSHIDECLSFAEKADILSSEELAQAKAVAPFLKNGETPGKCQNKAECEAYCADVAHFDECINFAQKAGFVSAEDAAMAKKAGGVGPGGCRSKEACDAYCNDESHANECANFALEKGLVDEKTAELIKNGIDQMKQSLANLPPEIRTDVQNCLNEKIGSQTMQRILDKQVSPTQKQGESIQSCFVGIEEKIKALMMQKAGGGAGAPSAEDIGNMIPSSVPPEIKDSIQQQIQSQMQTQGSVPPAGIPAAGGQVPSIDCSMFANVPSCTYVPSAVQSQCKQCKGQ